MIRLVAICVECGLDLAVARIDLDLDRVSKKTIFSDDWQCITLEFIDFKLKTRFPIWRPCEGPEPAKKLDTNHVSTNQLPSLNNIKGDIHSNSHPSQL